MNALRYWLRFGNRDRLVDESWQSLVDEAESAEIRRRILARVERLELAERRRPEMSRAQDGDLVEVWLCDSI